MHPKKIEHLRNKHKEENCLWGMTTANVNQPLIGSPCMAIIDPFVPLVKDFRFGIVKLSEAYPDSPLSKFENVKASDLYKVDTAMANSIISSSIPYLDMIIPFNINRHDNCDIICKKVPKSSFYFTGRVPLIYDTHKIIPADSLSVDDKKSLPDIVEDILKSHRFTVLMFDKVSKSNVHVVSKDISNIMSSFNKKYTKNVCMHAPSDGQYTNFLIDSVSISFYRLRDTVPIFDAKNANGIGIEISMTNSGVSLDNIENKRRPIEEVFRFAFSKTKENLFIIDGENIMRPEDTSMSNGLSFILSKLTANVPNDSVLLQKKAKEIGKNEEENLCAE